MEGEAVGAALAGEFARLREAPRAEQMSLPCGLDAGRSALQRKGKKRIKEKKGAPHLGVGPEELTQQQED